MRPSADALPPVLRRSTYQNRLRVVGRGLDLGGYGDVNLLEVPGGFLVRAMRPGTRTPEALEYPHDDFPRLIEEAIAARGEGQRTHRTHPLLPTGYEDLLRAVGFRLDALQAEAITVTELAGFVAVGGLGRVELSSQTSIAPFQHLLRPDDVGALLDDAFRRRSGDGAPAVGLGRRLARLVGG